MNEVWASVNSSHKLTMAPYKVSVGVPVRPGRVELPTLYRNLSIEASKEFCVRDSVIKICVLASSIASFISFDGANSSDVDDSAIYT